MHKVIMMTDNLKIYGIWASDQKMRGGGDWVQTAEGLDWSFSKGLMAARLRCLVTADVSHKYRVALIGDDGLPEEESKTAGA